MLSWAYATAQQAPTAPFRFYVFFLPLLMCMVHSARPLVCCRSSKVALNGAGDGSPFSFPILSDHPPKALGQSPASIAEHSLSVSRFFYLVGLNYYSTLPVELFSLLNSSSRFLSHAIFFSLLHRPWSCHSGYLVLFDTSPQIFFEAELPLTRLKIRRSLLQ